MSIAKITLIGIENYLHGQNKSVFDNMLLPTGIDKDTLCNNILLTGGEFELLYPNGDFLPEAISIWCAKWYRTFEKWVKATNIDYSPLENYDRIESWTDTGNSNGSMSNSASNSSEDKTSAYDSNVYQPNTQNIGSSNSSSNTNTQSANKHEGRLHGNIGVTTSQQMLQSEYDIALWNLYEHITDLFIKEFCIVVYE